LRERKLADGDGKHKPFQMRLLATKRKPATPGLSIGASRSFVDEVEDRLDAIRRKREMNAAAPKKLSSKSNKTGVADLGIHHPTKSAANRVVKEKKTTASKLSKVGGAFFGVFGGGSKEKKGQRTIAPTRAAGGAVKGTLQNNIGGKEPSNNSISEEVHKKWFRKNVGSVPSHVSEGDSPAVSSISGASKSSACSNLFGRRKNGMHVTSEDLPEASFGDTPVQSKDDSGVVSYSVVQRMTSFDSAIQGQPTTYAQFAVVEVGEDEDTMAAHHILMNKSDVEHQLTASKKKENTPAFANTGEALSAIDELDMLVESVSQNSSSLSYKSSKKNTKDDKSSKKNTKDDANLQKLELSTSFADQLQQMRQLRSIRNKNL
jgi:hypothetical protein